MSQPNYKLIYFNARGRAEHIRFIFAYAGIDYQDERIPREKWPELKKKMPFGIVPVLEIDGKRVDQSNAIARYLAIKYGLAGKDEWEAMQCDALVDTLGDLKQDEEFEGDFLVVQEGIQKVADAATAALLSVRSNHRYEKMIERGDGDGQHLDKEDEAPASPISASVFNENINKEIKSNNQQIVARNVQMICHILWQLRTEQDPIKKEERKAKLMRETIPFYLSKFEKIVAENNGYSVGTEITWCDFVFAVSLENFEVIFGKSSLDYYPALKALKNKIYAIPSIAEWVAKRPHTES